MKFWTTKYALTTGIEEVEAEDPISSEFPSMLCARQHRGLPTIYYHGKSWHRTCKGAVREAEEMREKKIKSLLKQIYKLEQLTFK